MKLPTLLLTLATFLFSLGAAAAQQSTFTPGNKIDIRIAGVPQEDQILISNVYTIAGNGTLNLPHLGEIKVAGLTQGALQQAIQNAYKAAQIFTNPTVIANVDFGESTRVITVAGEVKTPGPIPFREGITLLSAISAGGGFTDFANIKKIALIRNGRTTEHDYSQITKDPGRDVELQPEDKVLVRIRGPFGF